MKKHFFLYSLIAFTLSAGTVVLSSCGDDEDPIVENPNNQNNNNGNNNSGNNENGNNENGNPNNNGGEQGNASIAKTKWMGVVDCNDYVKIAVGTYTNYKLVDSLMACHDTIYYDFGVDVSYPTFTKITHLLETNEDKGSIEMWFDYKIKDNNISLLFRSFPPYDPGTRELKLIDNTHMQAEECGVKYELTRIK